ncbi:MAG TPA: sigma-70 family RNA polymerase sigma factor [Pirellulaceae bacterium]|nr:sigma-70 family RNA polymerase sigma factor [Pirellulaceae bacterium]
MEGEATIPVPELERLLRRLREGDPFARNELLEATGNRLMTMTKRMKMGYPNVGRWEQTEDVFQNALIRLHRSLADVVPEDSRHFFRLAALQIRRELLDMARHYSGVGKRHMTQGRSADDDGPKAAPEPLETSVTPERLMDWVDFHQSIEKLEEAEREVVELLWYHGLTQQEAADLLGVDVRTVKRRWRSARIALHDRLDGESPAD